MNGSGKVFSYLYRSTFLFVGVFVLACGMEGDSSKTDPSPIEALGHLPGQTLLSIDVTPADLTVDLSSGCVPGGRPCRPAPFLEVLYTATGNFSDGSSEELGVIQVAAGGNHTCAVSWDSTVKCWGRNNQGQLGDGTTTDSTTPVTVLGITGVSWISAGFEHTCAQAANTVYCWGRNLEGQLGNGTLTGSSSPVAVPGIPSAGLVAAGSFHSCATGTGGSLFCWGSNSRGALGNGTTVDSPTPVAVLGLPSSASNISAGTGHTCTKVWNGTTTVLYCWGENSSGQVGDGSTMDAFLPVLVAGVTDVQTYSARGASTCVSLRNGTVKCWGQGPLGDGTMGPSSTPVDVQGITNAGAVQVGMNHFCVILLDETMKCWGGNASGQLGDGTTTNSSLPVAVSGISNARNFTNPNYFREVSDHTCVVLKTGGLKCWGLNDFGQLGNGTVADSSLPLPVIGFPEVFWASRNTAVATIGGNWFGSVLASGDGLTFISATSGGVVGTTSLTVTGGSGDGRPNIVRPPRPTVVRPPRPTVR